MDYFKRGLETLCKGFVMLVFIFIMLSSLHAQTDAAFYIAVNGNDQNRGSIDHPFKTIDAALKAVERSSCTKATIFLRGGVYPIQQTVSMTAGKQDHQKPIGFSGYKNEQVTLLGGIKLDNAKFHKVTDKAILNRLPLNARNMVYVTELAQQGVSDLGEMKQNGIKAPVLPASLELFYDGEPLQIARWPNDSLLSIGKVVQRQNIQDNPGIMYDYSRPDKWSETGDHWVGGQFSVGWAYDNLPIDHIDQGSKTVYIKGTGGYGIYSSTDASSGSIRSARKIRGYYFYNILEELDKPGEWYLDRVAKKLYIWPPNSIKTADIEVSLLEQPMLKISGCRNIAIHAINFSCTRGIAIQIDNSENIAIDDCQFSNTGLQAIDIHSGSGIHINNCKVTHTGAGGIILSGGDRKTLTPSGNAVRNCEFYDYSRLYRTYTPAVFLDGVGDSILNCYIHSTPDQAITFAGNNHVIAYNYIKDVCYGFSDMGAIYTGRDPSAAGTSIRNNFFDHIQNENGVVAAVYIDDGSGGMETDQNLFNACGSGGFGAVHINGGGDNKFENNIFIDCPKAFSDQPWTDEQWKSLYIRNPAYLKKLTKIVDIRSDMYLKQYPFLKGFFDTASLRPRNNMLLNTVCYGVKTFSTGSGYIISNSFSAEANPVLAGKGDHNFNAAAIPNEVKQWPGWKLVDFYKIGKKGFYPFATE